MLTRQCKKTVWKSSVPSARGDQGRTALAWINCPSLNRIEHDESRFAIFTPKLEAAALNVSENTVFKNNQLKPRIALWDRFCGIALHCWNYCWSEMLISSASTLLPSYSAITLSSINCTEAVLLSWRSWRQRTPFNHRTACGPGKASSDGVREDHTRECSRNKTHVRNRKNDRARNYNPSSRTTRCKRFYRDSREQNGRVVSRFLTLSPLQV